MFAGANIDVARRVFSVRPQSRLSFFATATPTPPPTPPSRGFGAGFFWALAGVQGSPAQTAVCGGGFLRGRARRQESGWVSVLFLVVI